MKKYYESELDQLHIDDEHDITIQLRDSNGNKTKCLNLNDESIQALKVFLSKYSVTKLTKGVPNANV